MIDNVCKVCGRKLDKKYKHQLCDKHFSQNKKYGLFLDCNPRSEEDVNEFEMDDNMAVMYLYDLLEERTDEIVLLDLDDVEKVGKFRWNKKQKCIVGNILGKTVLLENYILNCDNKIEFVNGDNLDFRKNNLKIIEKRSKTKKVDKRKKGKIEIVSYGTSTIDVTGSCWGIEYDKSDGTRGLILLENGICQGGTVVEDYNANKRMADYIPYHRAEYMLFSHCHRRPFITVTSWYF